MSVTAFSKEEVLGIHAAAIERFGGLDGLCDEGLLDLAPAQPFQSFDGAGLYPSAIDKACRYAFGIISDHPLSMGTRERALPCSVLISECLVLISDQNMQFSSKVCQTLRMGRQAKTHLLSGLTAS